LKNNYLLIALFSFLLLNKANSQLLSNPLYNIKDTVFIGYNDGQYFLHYIVKKEDKLGNIAINYGSSIAALKDINGMTDNQLIEKKIIKIFFIGDKKLISEQYCELISDLKIIIND
jgi:hypothetical protein